ASRAVARLLRALRARRPRTYSVACKGSPVPAHLPGWVGLSGSPQPPLRQTCSSPAASPGDLASGDSVRICADHQLCPAVVLAGSSLRLPHISCERLFLGRFRL